MTNFVGSGRLADGTLDVIRIEALVVDCIVGVYPHERTTPQPLRVDLALGLDTRLAATGGGLKHSVDYARLCGELRFLLESCRFYLLETAADALCHYVLAPPTVDAPRAHIEEVTLRLTKPKALDGVQPSLEVHRRADEMTLEIEDKKFGHVDVVYEAKGCGIYRLRVAPGRSIPAHEHRVMDERELMLGDGLFLQGKPIGAGEAVTWPKLHAHRYDNPTERELSILCVDRPAFLPDDEVEMQPEVLPPVVTTRYYPSEASAARED